MVQCLPREASYLISVNSKHCYQFDPVIDIRHESIDIFQRKYMNFYLTEPGEPTTALEPTTAASEPTTAASEPTTAAPEPTTVATPATTAARPETTTG